MKRLVADTGPLLHLLSGLENSSLWLSATVRAQARAALAQIYPPTQQ